MRIFSQKGFTLVEIMIVIAILGILSVALFPVYGGYIERGRDTTRVANIDSLSKIHGLYLNDKDDYPVHLNGCVNETLLAQYTVSDVANDPVPNRSNGCNTLGKYGYAMSTGLLISPDQFSLIAIMEQPFAGNYTGSIVGMTGSLTQGAYTSGTTLTSRGNGRIYVRIP